MTASEPQEAQPADTSGGESARFACSGDTAAIETLFAGEHDAVLNHRGGPELLAGELAAAPTVESLLEREDAAVIVGTYDQVPLGVATITVGERSDGVRVATMHTMVVASEARKSGIGEAIMNLAQSWARQQGCQVIESMALPGDRNTKNFFESFGMKARLLIVGRSLDEA